MTKRILISAKRELGVIVDVFKRNKKKCLAPALVPIIGKFFVPVVIVVLVVRFKRNQSKKE